MKLHLRPLPNATDESLSAIKADMTDRLRRELAADRPRRDRHRDRSLSFKQQGDTE